MSASASASIPASTSVWQFDEKTGPLTLRTVATPVAGAGQILVRVAAVALNPVDWKMQDYSFFNMPLPASLGYDVAGTVVALGAGVSGKAVGDRVAFGAALNGSGALAEYVVVDVSRTVRIPCRVSFIQAASFPIAFLSAYDGLAHLHLNGKTVFVPGGAGGVGHFAVQFAKANGARVIASASRPDSLYVVSDVVGADHTINYAKEDPVAAVLALTNGEGADIVFDATYVASSFAQSAAAVKKGGVVSILGQPASDDVKKAVEARGATVEQADLVRYWLDKAADNSKVYVDGLAVGLKLAAERKVVPYISKVVSFADAAAAIKELRSNKNLGKVVVTLDAYGHQ